MEVEMSTTEPRSRYHEARMAGRDWALQELQRAGGNRNTVADIEDQLYEVTVAYVALQTGRLPSLFLDPDAREIELSEGFHTGANDIISGYRLSRAASH
jgi:hypothetical protein